MIEGMFHCVVLFSDRRSVQCIHSHLHDGYSSRHRPGMVRQQADVIACPALCTVLHVHHDYIGHKGSPPKRFPPPQRCRTASAASLLTLDLAETEGIRSRTSAIRTPSQLVDLVIRLTGSEKRFRKREGVDRRFGRRRCVGACIGR